MDMIGNDEPQFTGYQRCMRTEGSGAVCTESAGGPGANFPGVSTTSYEESEAETLVVTVTAGSEKLNAGRAEASATSGTGAMSGSGAADTTASVTRSTGAADQTTTRSETGGQYATESAAMTASSGAAFATDGVILGGGVAAALAAGVLAWAL